MKKKGFTLIELLAVIVVLAIIALIATPIVMNTIKNSKKGAAERTADNYVDQVETSLMTYRLENGENLPDGEYEITSDGNLCKDKTSSCKEQDQIKIEMNGTKPSSGTIVIENGQVKKDRTTMKVGDYDVTYDTTKKTFTANESTGNNVEVLCKAKTEITNGNKAEGNFNYGDEYSCELGDGEAKTFYVLENNTDTLSLIMNMNIDSNGRGTIAENPVEWCKSGYDNSCAADGAIEYLKSSTESWTKLDSSQISLPSGQQIATAGGDTVWTDGNYTGNTLPTWLYENLNDSSAPYAYWTSTPHAFYSNFAWNVDYDGSLDNGNVDCDYYYGVRPVITISKSQVG